MKKIPIIVLLYGICTITMFSQKSYVVDTINTNNDLSQYNSGEWYTHRRTMGGLEGTGFVFENFMNGKILVNDSTLSEETYVMNVDAYTNEVKYMKEGKEYTIYNTNKFAKYTGVLMTDSLHQRYLFKRIKLSSKNDDLTLAEVLHQGKKYTLYKHIDKRLHKADLTDRGIITTGKSVNSFDEYDDYYIKVRTQTLQKISLRRNSFFELVQASKIPQLENHCKENKIGKNLTDEQAVQLIRIIETL